MFKTNLILAFRSLIKEKGFSFINILGLALGLACFLLLTVFVLHEHSYEKFRPDYERIYRIYSHGSFDPTDEISNWGYMPYKATNYLKDNYPEIEQLTTVDVENGFVMTYKDKYFIEWRCLVGDSSFYDMFPATFLKGVPKGSLDGPHKIVLTETAAKKWFGEEDPIGKMVSVSFDDNLFEVTGVIKDPRSDTHIRYDVLISDESLKYGDNNTWWRSRWRMNYVKLKAGVNVNAFERKLQKMMYDGMGSELEQNSGTSLEEYLKHSKMPEYKLQKLQDIYKNPILDYELLGQKANPTLMSIAIIIALALLILACINYVNLSTARYSNRLKEICVKKAVGASKKSLFIQFIIESYVVTFISIFLGLAIAEISMEAFCDMLNLEFVMHIFDIPYIYIFVFALFILVGFVSGVYPAIVMARTNIISGFRGGSSKGKNSDYLRKALVVLQFVVSFVIVLGALVVKSQLNFIEADNKGYSKENVVIFHNLNKDISNEKWFTLRDEVTKIDGVKIASLCSSLPSEFLIDNSVTLLNDSLQTPYNFNFQIVDANYLETMNISLIEGQGFRKDMQYDTLSAIINEAAVREYKLENPIGKIIHFKNNNFGDRNVKILGIVKDYNVLPVKEKIKPILLFQPLKTYQKLLVKFKDKNHGIAKKKIEDLWRNISGGKNVHAEYMQESLDWHYRSEISANKIVATFSIICVLIACLGLLGLVSYSTIRRTKEIGIRKALGAQVFQILISLSKDTIMLIAIAIIIALPIAFYVIQIWLDMFAYHVSIEVWQILLSMSILYAIALLSELSLTLKVARKNPIESLRYE